MKSISFKTDESKGPVVIGRRDPGRCWLVRDLVYYNENNKDNDKDKDIISNK
jgi:hypothetical protein